MSAVQQRAGRSRPVRAPMFEADLDRTQRRAMVDRAPADRVEFAKRSLAWARENGAAAVVWHFAAKQSLSYVSGSGRLSAVAAQLTKAGRAGVGGVEILLATRRKQPHGATFNMPAAAWWP